MRWYNMKCRPLTAALLFNVLIIHGEHDNLVLPDEAFACEKNSFAGPKRLVFIPGANHNIFCGTNRAMAIDIVRRAVVDHSRYAAPRPPCAAFGQTNMVLLSMANPADGCAGECHDL